MSVAIATYKFFAFASRLGSGAREKGRDAVGEPASRQMRTVEMRRCAVVGGVLNEGEHGNNGCADGTKSPPEDIVPWLLVGNESTQGSATDDSKDDEDLKDGKRLAPLMQKEHIDDVPSSQNRRYHTEQTGNKS